MLSIRGPAIYFRVLGGVLGSGATPDVFGAGVCTEFPPGAGTGMEFPGRGDGACPCGAITAPEEPGASWPGGGDCAPAPTINAAIKVETAAAPTRILFTDVLLVD